MNEWMNFSIDPDNSNPRELELFFVSLQSSSYRGSTVFPLDRTKKKKEENIINNLGGTLWKL